MTSRYSVYDIIKSYAPQIKVHLYIPAHQGISGNPEYFDNQLYEYDFPFLIRSELEDIEKYFSQLYKTKHTFFLTGGASQGILAACTLLARKHRRIAIGLNSHISVIHGIVLSGLEPLFIPSNSLMPTADEVIWALENSGQEVSAVLLTHPSYEGRTTDIREISKYCCARKIELAIDEAHGSHFPFIQDKLPSALLEEGSLVIHSLYKYVGSFVKTALLHIPEKSTTAVEEVMSVLSLFESTTQSNLLTLSIEDSIKIAFGDEGKALFSKAIQSCNELRKQIDHFGTALNYDWQVRDPLKLFLYSDRATGNEIGDLLFERGVSYEYSNEKGVLLIFSFRHTNDDFVYVLSALKQVNEVISSKNQNFFVNQNEFCRHPVMQTLPREAFFSKKRKKLTLEQAKSRISCCCLKKVPPGIPILIPGEEVTNWHSQMLPPDTVLEVVDD